MKPVIKIELMESVINGVELEVPKYATPGASGCDLRANICEQVTLLPLDRVTVPTGVKIGMPAFIEAQVRGRSGLAMKHGIIVAPGTIDSDYRGEIRATIINMSREPYTIQPLERIAQLVFCYVYAPVEWERVEALDVDTERGVKGFGHSGKE